MDFQYHSSTYWDQRYQKQDGAPFEWLETYERVRLVLLQKALKTYNVYPHEKEYLTDFHRNNLIKDRCEKIEVLDVGCGTSTFLQEMYDRDGFRKINAIDLSASCIKQMDLRNA